MIKNRHIRKVQRKERGQVIVTIPKPLCDKFEEQQPEFDYLEFLEDDKENIMIRVLQNAEE